MSNHRITPEGPPDFDSSAAGVQTITDGPAATVVLNAGAGADSITIGGRTGAARTVKIKLSRGKRRLLRRLGKARVTIGIAVSTPGGATARRQRTLTLKPPAA